MIGMAGLLLDTYFYFCNKGAYNVLMNSHKNIIVLESKVKEAFKYGRTLNLRLHFSCV